MYHDLQDLSDKDLIKSLIEENADLRTRVLDLSVLVTKQHTQEKQAEEQAIIDYANMYFQSKD
jgi:regulator of replication initiation timing